LSANQIEWLHNRAHEMRRNPTEPEKRLWRALSSSQIGGLKFRRQEVIGPYIADFMCPARSLIVEVDGDTHDCAKDRLRDDVLAQFGFLVLRVGNGDVMANAEGVVEAIRLAAAGRASRHKPHPNPTPEGEGLNAVEAQKLLGISLEGSVG
jgi:very-short-patch-repair endonuclease